MQLIDVQLCATMIVHFLVGNVTAVDLTLSQKESVNVTGSVTALYPIEQDAAELYTKPKTKGLKRIKPFSQLGRRRFSRRLTEWLRMLDMLLEPRVLLRKCMQDALPRTVPVPLIR